MRIVASLLALCLLCAPARADDEATPEGAAAEAVRRYARERLLQRARDTVDPSRREVGGLDALKQSLAEKRVLLQRLDGARWAELERLLGTWDEGTRKSTDGLIQQGAIFYRWMSGKSDEMPALHFAGVPNPERDGRGPEISVPFEGSETPVEVLVLGRLDVQRLPDKQVVLAGVDDLRTVQDPMRKLALTRSDEMNSRYCQEYVDARQLQVAPRVESFKADVPSAGLVSAGTVRAKTERAVRLRERVNRVIAQQEGGIAALDRLAKEERELRRGAGTLGFEIEEARRAAEVAAAERAEAEARKMAEAEEPAKEPAKEEEKPEGGDAGAEAETPKAAAPRVLDATEEKLETLRLREIVDAQKLRLLYVSVRRADLRGRLLATVLNQVKEEAVAAEDAQQRYTIELARMRRERQMDRLAYEQSSLALAHTEARKQATEAEEAVRPVWAAYDTALGALTALNGATTDAVEMRRTLEARTKPVDRASVRVRDEEGCLPPAPVRTDAPTQDPAPDVPVRDVLDRDPLRRFRSPSASTLDVTYVNDAMGFLDDPAWNTRMTAAHYEAVDDRIQALHAAGTIVRSAADLERRFGDALQTAEGALAQVETLSRSAPDPWRWSPRLIDARSEWLDPNVKAFNETMRGIRDESENVQADIAVYERFRERLLRLGTRSFGVRVQRKLDSDKLGAASGDVAATLRRVGRWVTLQDEPNLGTFVRANWLMLLACIGVLVGSVFLVRFGRGVLDRKLHAMARGVKQLRAEPVTIGAEQAQAHREAAQAEVAAREAEEAALREVSKDEAAKAQPMGEGGYIEEGA